jgi:signal transduction histidine kinase
VKDIIEAHGGDISVESRRNKGSTFIIRIPII